MNVLFIHDAFPAQFGRLGQELATQHGWKCSFLVQSLSSCPTPTPEMLEAVELHQMPHDGRASRPATASPGRRSTGSTSTSAARSST